jgi:hypothetical protein
MNPGMPLVAVGELNIVAVEGGTAPRGIGGAYRRIGSASVNDAGAIAFAAELTGSEANEVIVKVVNGRGRVLVCSGGRAPGGGRYAGFGELDLGDDGSLLFQARLADTGDPEGVFLRTAAGTRPVARGDREYGQLTLTSYTLDGGPYFRLAYVMKLADGRRRLVIWPSYRDPSTVMTTGDQLAGGELMEFTVSRLGFAVCAVARINRDGEPRQVALLASEDQLIWGPRLREGARFPELGRITGLLAPSGMYVHHGLVAAGLDDGRTVLVTRSGGSDPEVFACSGDPAPGMPDHHITRFGSPLANHGLPAGGPCGIASVVTLSSGDPALWLGVFAGQLPMAGAAITPLVAGDYTDGSVPARVDSIDPIKLTNAGSLLLRSTLDLDGRATGGLVLLDRLFDWCRFDT